MLNNDLEVLKAAAKKHLDNADEFISKGQIFDAQWELMLGGICMKRYWELRAIV